MLWALIQFCAIVFTIAHIIRKILDRTLYNGVDITKEEDVRNKIIIITGSSAGIGLQTAYEFAARDAHVIMACRDKGKAEEAMKWIRSKTNMGNLEFMKLELASLESVRCFVEEFTGKYDKVHILVNNAGVAVSTKEKPHKTDDGFEMQMGVNHLGHFLLTNLLLEPLKKAAPSRIVHVSSMVHPHANLDLDDLMSHNIDNKNVFPPLHFIPIRYSRSKMAQVLFNHELAKRLKGTGVTSYALCPGAIYTNMARKCMWSEFLLIQIVRYFFKTQEQGASTTMYCALNKDLANESGQMYHYCSTWDPLKRASYTDEETKILWKISAKYVKL